MSFALGFSPAVNIGAAGPAASRSIVAAVQLRLVLQRVDLAAAGPAVTATPCHLPYLVFVAHAMGMCVPHTFASLYLLYARVMCGHIDGARGAQEKSGCLCYRLYIRGKKCIGVPRKGIIAGFKESLDFLFSSALAAALLFVPLCIVGFCGYQLLYAARKNRESSCCRSLV